MNLLGFFKNNLLTSILFIVIVLLLLLRNVSGQPLDLPQYGLTTEMSTGVRNIETGVAMGKIMPPVADYAPASDVQNRLVIDNSSLALQVKNVRETANAIIAHAKGEGGYMVTSTMENPGESPTGMIVFRIPSVKLQQTLAYLRGLAIKVVSENLIGEDVTDQYVDNEARLSTLMKTKEKFDAIMERAVEISDITNIQQQLINLQSQIDAVKGQQLYLEQNAKLAKITVYLSTDELALPYAPSDAWRPEVIFKQAVRSLVGEVRKAGTFLIWAGVYSIVWIPALALAIYLLRRAKKV